MPSSDPDNDRYDINMKTGQGNAIGPNAQVHNITYEHSQAQVDLEEAYYKEMSRLLFGNRFLPRSRQSVIEAEQLTLRMLSRSYKARKREILQYLYAQNLIKEGNCIIHLMKADLTEANLSGANLNGANLRGANLFYADLSANLSSVNLEGATMPDDSIHP